MGKTEPLASKRRKSLSAVCGRKASAVCWFVALPAAIPSRSAPTNGLMTAACTIWSRISSVRLPVTAAPMSGRILIETNNRSSPTRPAIGSNLIESLAFLAAAGGYCPAGVRGTHETKSTGNSALMGVDGFCPNRNRSGYLLDRLFCDRSNGHVF